MEKSRMTPRRVAYIGILSGLGFGLSYIELLIPSVGLPGAKLGLANLAVLASIYFLSFTDAALVSFIRIMLSWIFFGSFTAMLYSLAGSFASLIVMFAVKKTDLFSVIGVSIAGGAAHNIGQLIAACAVLGMGAVGYLPALMVFGTISGAVVGILASLLLRALGKGEI